jgi:hypothetical protein
MSMAECQDSLLSLSLSISMAWLRSAPGPGSVEDV